MDCNTSSFDEGRKHGQYPIGAENIIETFMRNKDVAPWYRGTSVFHRRGSSDLFNAIRDDTEQRTTHRVKNCLNLIGLDPMITSKDIALLMRISRGNDLAFLWFLLEMHYTGSLTENVGLNEQLICTAICQLDMITTLRELDRILPPGRDSSKCKRESAQKGKKRTTSSTVGNRRRKSQPKYVLPYFEKLPRPTKYGRPLTIDIPNFVVEFNLYAAYKDPNYKVPNESNRWYANYDFHPGRWVAFDILKTAISEIFENYTAAKLKADNTRSLCQYHKKLERIQANEKLEIIVQVKQQQLKSIFPHEEERAQRLDAVKDCLYKAIDQELANLKKQLEKPPKKNTLKTITSDCEIIDVVLGTEYDECCLQSMTIKNGESTLVVQDSGDCAATKALGNQSSTLKDILECETGTGDYVTPQDPNPKAVDESLPMHIRIANRKRELARWQKYCDNYDYGHAGDTPTPSQTYFYRATKYRGHRFDYNKIFPYQGEPIKPTKDSIKEALFEGLDHDISNLTTIEIANTDVGKIAANCAEKTWRTHLKKFQNEFNQLLPMEAPAVYNPEDETQMDQMLADAFEKMRQNPKFVLAQLPHAHKQPILREWIARRYGKVYTPQQRVRSFQYSLKVFHALNRMSFDFQTPTATDLGKNRHISYDCRDFLVKKIKSVKDKYYDRLNNELMKQSRNYWFAMRGYLCSSGPPIETFFAYMPSRVSDIQHFRLWKSDEHRPDKIEWDNRMLAKYRK